MKIWNTTTKELNIINDFSLPPLGWTNIPPQWTSFEVWDTVNNCWGISLDLVRQKQFSLISDSFITALSQGNFKSITLGIQVDCRRDATHNDIDNVRSLIADMQAANMESMTYRGYNEGSIRPTANATLLQVQALLLEMQQYGLSLYNKKFELEDKITEATTIEAIQMIIWL